MRPWGSDVTHLVKESWNKYKDLNSILHNLQTTGLIRDPASKAKERSGFGRHMTLPSNLHICIHTYAGSRLCVCAHKCIPKKKERNQTEQASGYKIEMRMLCICKHYKLRLNPGPEEHHDTIWFHSFYSEESSSPPSPTSVLLRAPSLWSPSS